MVSTLKLTKIQIPNSDSDVISLDASTGNITLNKTLGGTSVTVQGEGTATTNLQQGLCKCFANLDMTDGTQVQNSFNLTSMTDNATGQPQLNFTNVFSNAKFCLTGTHDVYSARAGGIESSDDRGNTTSISKMRVNNSSGTTVDSREIMLEVVGDLA